MLFKRKEKYTLDMDRIPAHIAFIMEDGLKREKCLEHMAIMKELKQ